MWLPLRGLWTGRATREPSLVLQMPTLGGGYLGVDTENVLSGTVVTIWACYFASFSGF
jgi:hypothetical protein